MKLNASGDPVPSSETDSNGNEALGQGKGDPFGHFRGVINSLPPVVFVVSIILVTFSVIYRKRGLLFLRCGSWDSAEFGRSRAFLFS